MADRRIDQLTEAESIADEDLFVIWKQNISQTRSIAKGTMNSYVKNQNILSDLESIVISFNSASPTIMEYDGYLVVSLKDSSATGILADVYVNNTMISIGCGRGQEYVMANSSATVPVNKGDSVYIQLIDGSTSSLSTSIRQYKLRDYTGR